MKRIEDFRIVGKQSWQKTVLLKLASETALPEIQPGQFVQVKVEQSPSTYLRRPISIHHVLPEKREIWLLIQKVGDGTRQLSTLQPGNSINLVYPLGNGFSLPATHPHSDNIIVPAPGNRPLLIGGGVGIAPLLYLGVKLREQGLQPSFLLGGRSASDLIQLEEFETVGQVYCTTEDGSRGTQGFVTDHPVMQGSRLLFDSFYCCGPKPMMMAVAKVARQHHLFCEVSLENTMACGIGACLCCVENTVQGHRCVCKEGPVFQLDQLLW